LVGFREVDTGELEKVGLGLVMDRAGYCWGKGEEETIGGLV